MKLASSIVISAALHAAVFVCAISFPGSGSEQLTPVTVVSLEQEMGDASGRHGTGSNEVRAAGPKDSSMARSSERLIAKPTMIIAPGQPTPSVDVSGTASEGVTVALSTDSFSPDSNAAAPGSVAGGGSAGTGQSETGSGLGSGRGIAQGERHYTRVRYSDTPKPKYPETARRDGKEGRVLLRVLVNMDGRSASVEVNRSSGVEALDRAAVEVIKHWRFFPARFGDKTVESWVRIPIDFRLTNARN